jgi:hypothetical protein
MPSCGTLVGRYEPCKQYVGGIKGAFFIPFEFANTIVTDGAGLITQINNGATPPVKVTGYFWELKGLSTLETTITASRDNGTTMYESIFTLSFKPSGLTPAAGDLDMDSIQTLSKGRWQIVIWDRNDQFWLIGQTLGCDANGGSSSWGVQMGDARLNTITFSSQEKTPPSPIDADNYTELSTSVIIVSTAP